MRSWHFHFEASKNSEDGTQQGALTRDTVFIRFTPSFQGLPRVTAAAQPATAAAGAGAGAGKCRLDAGGIEGFGDGGVGDGGFDELVGIVVKGFVGAGVGEVTGGRGASEGCGLGVAIDCLSTVMYQGCRSIVLTR